MLGCTGFKADSGARRAQKTTPNRLLIYLASCPIRDDLNRNRVVFLSILHSFSTNFSLVELKTAVVATSTWDFDDSLFKNNLFSVYECFYSMCTSACLTGAQRS